MLLERLKNLAIQVFNNTKLEGIYEGRTVISSIEGKKSIFDADLVVLALGSVPDNRLAISLKTAGAHFYLIGDSKTPSNVMGAIHDAALIGREI